MTAFLIIDDDNGVRKVPCENVVTIGRDNGSDIVLPNLQVSRNHAIVRRLGGNDFYFVDSGSSNGSWLNGRRVTAPEQLSDGDRLTIGETELQFEQQKDSAGFADTAAFQATMIADRPLIQEITILVADIRGFTTLSEQMPIQSLTRLMNRWFHEVTRAIHEHGGVVDKFIGDCVFARWEGTNPGANVLASLQTAAQINEITAMLGRDERELPFPLRIGVGVNTGMASLGIGAENTALGDAVNTAFRLESASKDLGVDVVLSESAYSLLPGNPDTGAVRELALKGKTQPVQVMGLKFPDLKALLGSDGAPGRSASS